MMKIIFITATLLIILTSKLTSNAQTSTPTPKTGRKVPQVTPTPMTKATPPQKPNPTPTPQKIQTTPTPAQKPTPSPTPIQKASPTPKPPPKPKPSPTPSPAPEDKKPIKMAGGLGMGGNFTPLISDMSTTTFGSGVGNQYSLYVAGFRERPTSLKLRMDMLKTRQQSLSRSSTDYYFPQTRFRSAEQNWTILSASAERIYEGRSQTLFWDLGLGYAFGRGGTFTISDFETDQATASFPLSQNSYWVITGGLGIRKHVWKQFTGLLEFRTIGFLKTIYSEGPLSATFLTTIPLMLNFTIEYEFDIGR